jgi:hypothetical protein
MKLLMAIGLVFSLAAFIMGVRTQRLGPDVPSFDLLRNDLESTQRRLQLTESKLTKAVATLDALERQTAIALDKKEAASPTPTKKLMLSGLAQGSYEVEHEAVVFSPDAKLRLLDDMTISSPTGVMVSDLNQKMIVGNLKIETPNGTLRADSGVIDLTKRMISAKGASFTGRP